MDCSFVDELSRRAELVETVSLQERPHTWRHIRNPTVSSELVSLEAVNAIVDPIDHGSVGSSDCEVLSEVLCCARERSWSLPELDCSDEISANGPYPMWRCRGPVHIDSHITLERLRLIVLSQGTWH